MSGLFQDDPPADDAPPPPDGPGLFGDALPAAAPPAQAAAYRVLARKYRPTQFSDLIGQETMVRTLRNAFATGRVAHAFMLTGVRGVGKTTTARIIARALNCVGPDGAGGPTADPCGVCDNCRAILAEREPDVFEMDAASRTGVDDVREIIEVSRSRPMKIRTKVFIIDEVHMLTRNAFNALLKTLEEPPPHVKFVFATTEIRKVPITVLSRCQRFDLRRVRVAELTAHFGGIAEKEGVTIEPGALDMIARAADGSVRDGLSLLDQAIAQTDGPIRDGQVADMLGVADRIAVFDLMDALMAGNPRQALQITERLYERGADIGVVLQDLLELIHTITRLKVVPTLRDSGELPEAERTRSADMADRLAVPTLGRAWQMLLKGVSEVETAPDRRAAAEMVLIRLCHVAELPTPGDLVRRLGGGATSASAAPAPSGGPTGGGVRAMAGGGAVMEAAPAPATLRFSEFRDVLALVADRREAMLHAHLVHSVHLVRFAPPVIELRPQPDAPKDLASKLAALLTDATGTRWTIALSTAVGDATLAEQGSAADAARRSAAADHPLVRAIMEAFPGARIDQVHDATADAYGLPAIQAAAGEAVPDTDFAEEMESDE
ncbi:MAG TPA: DNA polymerase III subunit gamma/tau [Acetobacteraceae bacterium]|nr:DNA polymerase III subunit gamma/tau [Acetobacteraceae bacterium]